MDDVLDRPLTTEAFLAWEDRQEGKYEFDGRDIIPITGGTFAHQDIVFNLRGLLGRLLAGQPYRVGQEMRLRIGRRADPKFFRTRSAPVRERHLHGSRRGDARSLRAA